MDDILRKGIISMPFLVLQAQVCVLIYMFPTLHLFEEDNEDGN